MPGPQPTIVLIGLRGAGKTTVARVLATRLGLTAVDLDDRTPKYAGEASVADVFSRKGEPAFREAETRALADALSEPGIVLALGGGTPTAPGAADLLTAARVAGRAWIAYLRADAPTLAARLRSADNAHRPSLTGAGVVEEVAALLAARDSLYREVADAVIEVGGLTPEQAAERVLALTPGR